MLQWNEQFYDVLDYFKWQRNKTGDKWPEDCENYLDWPCKFNFLMSVELLLFTERLFDILTWSPNFWLGIEIYHYRHNFDSQGLSKVNRTFFYCGKPDNNYYELLFRMIHVLPRTAPASNIVCNQQCTCFKYLSHPLTLCLRTSLATLLFFQFITFSFRCHHSRKSPFSPFHAKTAW